jgi:hypothetical protein
MVQTTHYPPGWAVAPPHSKPPPAPAPAPKAKKPKPAGVWMALRLGVTFGVGGDRPAKPTLVSPGGGLDIGYRLSEHVAIASGISGQIHDKALVDTGSKKLGSTQRFGSLVAWDALLLRFYAGQRGRLQPYIEVGGGMSFYNRPSGGTVPGPHLRAGLGFERWVSDHLTVGIAGTYRLTGFEMKYTNVPATWAIGHGVQALFDLGFHW